MCRECLLVLHLLQQDIISYCGHCIIHIKKGVDILNVINLEWNATKISHFLVAIMEMLCLHTRDYVKHNTNKS